MEPMTQTVLKDIQADVHSGATEITRKGAQYLVTFSEECAVAQPQDYWTHLVEAGRNLIAAQPSMASLFNLVNYVLCAVEPLYRNNAAVHALQQGTRDATQRFTKASEDALDEVARQGQSLVTTGATVMTHSSSSSIAGILRLAVRQGKALKAICTESRPYCEGREFSRALGAFGIPARLILDAAIPQFVKQADVILCGADQVSEDIFTNKIGTLALAMAAKAHSHPFYIACETAKFLPSAYAPAKDIFHTTEERDQEEWENVELVYSFFEEIPLPYVTGIITEEGILSVNALAKRFKAFRVCDVLRPTAERPAGG